MQEGNPSRILSMMKSHQGMDIYTRIIRILMASLVVPYFDQLQLSSRESIASSLSRDIGWQQNYDHNTRLFFISVLNH
jgi:hypothetical protein